MLGDRHRLTEWYFYGAKLLEQAANPCLLGITLPTTPQFAASKSVWVTSAIAPVAASVADKTIIANNRFFDMR